MNEAFTLKSSLMISISKQEIRGLSIEAQGKEATNTVTADTRAESSRHRQIQALCVFLDHTQENKFEIKKINPNTLILQLHIFT